ncbi:MAG: hypothetical protein AB7P76_02315 [Candidatus Melainabacteria bacterium]
MSASMSQPATETARQALSSLNDEARRAMAALEAGQWMLAQNRLEDCLQAALHAAQLFQLNPDAALARARQRLADGSPATTQNRRMIVYPDRAELVRDGVVCGSWPIGSAEEAATFVQLGHELQCVVEQPATEQLALFHQ